MDPHQHPATTAGAIKMPDPMRILVIDDSGKDANLILRVLRKKWPDLEIMRIDTEESMKSALSDNTWDAISCDQKMPEFSAEGALNILKERGLDIPFIVVSGVIDMKDAVALMKSGAHDFVRKDDLARLVPSLERELRETDVRRARIEAESKLALSDKKLHDGLLNTVKALASALELRDPYTAGHQARVSELSCAVGREMKMSDDDIEGLSLAALIHDIGKIYVPIEILVKPTKLTHVEIEMIRTHPQYGYDIVKDLEFPWPVANMIKHHHERMDGSGYPDGISGEAICMGARIIAVSDTVESMSTNRPYRPAIGLAGAILEILNGKGTSFDADVVDACVSVIRNKKFSFSL